MWFKSAGVEVIRSVEGESESYNTGRGDLSGYQTHPMYEISGGSLRISPDPTSFSKVIR